MSRRHLPSLGALGRALLVGAGLLVAFVAYQLWGTGVVQAQHQRSLRQQFDRSVAAHGRARATDGTTPQADGAPPAPATAAPSTPPAVGHPVGTLSIPAIGVDQVVVEGVGLAQLAVGPGHYPGTPLPGEPGNAAIAGHRTTHGRPFYDLNALAVGDRVVVTTVQGTFTYRVTRSEVVAPTDVAVLDPSSVPELTLTTCTPRYSAAQRLVVVARLISPPSPSVVAAAVPSAHPTVALAGPDPVHQAGDWIALVAWGAVAVGLVWLTWALRRRWAAGAGRIALGVAVPVAAVVLFFFFGAVNAMLPSSF